MPAKKADPKKVNVRAPKVDSSEIENPNTVPIHAEERKGAHPQTILRVEECAKMISKGKGKNDVIDYMQTKYGYTYDHARRYYIAGCHFLIPDDQPEFRASLIKQNIERLEKIINDSMDKGQYKVAREAIDSLNKTLGVVGGNSITINQDPDSGQQQIIVNFG